MLKHLITVFTIIFGVGVFMSSHAIAGPSQEKDTELLALVSTNQIFSASSLERDANGISLDKNPSSPFNTFPSEGADPYPLIANKECYDACQNAFDQCSKIEWTTCGHGFQKHACRKKSKYTFEQCKNIAYQCYRQCDQEYHSSLMPFLNSR